MIPAFLNCDGCRGTLGAAGCPTHRNSAAAPSLGVNVFITTCVHGVDLRFVPRCYLCKPEALAAHVCDHSGCIPADAVRLAEARTRRSEIEQRIIRADKTLDMATTSAAESSPNGHVAIWLREIHRDFMGIIGLALGPTGTEALALADSGATPPVKGPRLTAAHAIPSTPEAPAWVVTQADFARWKDGATPPAMPTADPMDRPAPAPADAAVSVEVAPAVPAEPTWFDEAFSAGGAA